MTEYTIPAPTRICAATGRPLQPGERYIGVVALEGPRLVRREFSPEAWTGPPPEAIGYWTGRVPPGDAAYRPPIDDDMLMECFQRLAGETEDSRRQFRYVIGLLLVRRKRFRLDDVIRSAEGESLVLRDARSGQKFTLPDPNLTDEQMAQLERDVFQMLGWTEA